MKRAPVKTRRRFWMALAAILAIYAAKQTGLDQGLIDELLGAGAEVIIDDPEAGE